MVASRAIVWRYFDVCMTIFSFLGISEARATGASKYLHSIALEATISQMGFEPRSRPWTLEIPILSFSEPLTAEH
jgi:hypothetical protein